MNLNRQNVLTAVLSAIMGYCIGDLLFERPVQAGVIFIAYIAVVVNLVIPGSEEEPHD